MPVSIVLITGAMAAVFALIHLEVGRLEVLGHIPRNRWLSFAGGVAVAYVFLHILPELSAHQEEFTEALGLTAVTAESLIYAMALVGLGTFYGVERAVKLSRERSQKKGQGSQTEESLLALHIGSFAVFNLLIGYLLLHREEFGLWSLALYFVAIGLHFLTSDFGMRADHEEVYDRMGRWVIAAAVIGGWALGVITQVPQLVVGLLFAFVSGGIVLNVLKEELPEERKSRFLPFAGGATLYAALTLTENLLA